MASNYTTPYYGYSQYPPYASPASDTFRLRSRSYGDISDMLFQPQYPAQYHLPQQFQQAQYPPSTYQQPQYYATHHMAPIAIHPMQGMQGMTMAMPPATPIPSVSHIPMQYSQSSTNIPKSSSAPRVTSGNHLNASTKVKPDTAPSASSSAPPTAGPARYRVRHHRSVSTPVQTETASTMRPHPGRNYAPSTSSSRESSIDSDSLQANTISSGTSMHSADSSIQEDECQLFKTRKSADVEPPFKSITQNAEQVKRINYMQRKPESKDSQVITPQQHAVRLQNAKRIIPGPIFSPTSQGSNVTAKAPSKLILPSDLRPRRGASEAKLAITQGAEQNTSHGTETEEAEKERQMAYRGESPMESQTQSVKDTQKETNAADKKINLEKDQKIQIDIGRQTENAAWKEDTEKAIQRVNEKAGEDEVQKETEDVPNDKANIERQADSKLTPESSKVAPSPVHAPARVVTSAPIIIPSYSPAPSSSPSPASVTSSYPKAPLPTARSNISSDIKSPEVRSPEPDAYAPTKYEISEPKKSRSFGTKFRNIFRKQKPEIDSDQKSIISTKSTQSTFSVRSTASIRSFFGKKNRADSAPNIKSPPLPPQQAPRSPPVPALHRRSQSLMSTPASSPSVKSSTTRGVRNDSSGFIPRPPSPALRSIHGFKAPSMPQGPPTDPMARANIGPRISKEKRPEPSGKATEALRPSEPRSDSSLTVPTNLSAGDLSPRALTEGDVETLVCPLSRTNSITSNREPSSYRRTSEDRVHNPTEVEASPPPKHEDTIKLVSAMKSSRCKARRRSGATAPGSVSFASQILIYRTFSPDEYNRSPDWMTSDIIREPGVAQMLREELNEWKANMRVHPDSAHNTQFFQVKPSF